MNKFSWNFSVGIFRFFFFTAFFKDSFLQWIYYLYIATFYLIFCAYTFHLQIQITFKYTYNKSLYLSIFFCMGRHFWYIQKLSAVTVAARMFLFYLFYFLQCIILLLISSYYQPRFLGQSFLIPRLSWSL